MKNKIIKLGTGRISQNKSKFLAIILFSLTFFNLYGQSNQYIGNGTYQFDSFYPEWDLHFWLYDDGYHSFEHSPRHQYGNNNLPGSPVLYHAEPYDDTHVNNVPVGLIYNGVSDPIPDVLQLQNQIEVKRSWNLVNSEENFYILMFENNQYSESISGCVEFHFNTTNTSIVSTNILDDYNNNWVGQDILLPSDYEGYTHKYVWQFHGLEPSEQRFIYIPASCLASSMSTVFTRGVLKVNECNVIYEDDFKTDGANEGIINSPLYTLRSVVSNHPHDPNFILSDPICLEEPAEELPLTVRYKLYFQNEGVDPTLDVFNTFFSNIEFASVLLVNSSYPCYLTWEGQVIYAGFSNINLRGLNEETTPSPTYDQTVGWIEFDVCYNLEDVNGDLPDCIEIEGHVIFDNQPPIIAQNSICHEAHCNNNNVFTASCESTPHSQGEFHGDNNKLTTTSINDKSYNLIEVMPNPAYSEIRINTSSIKNYSSITILNTLGEVVLDCGKINVKQKLVDVSNLKPGTYFVRMKNNGSIESMSFIKI